jgi:hypothetical protein
MLETRHAQCPVRHLPRHGCYQSQLNNKGVRPFFNAVNPIRINFRDSFCFARAAVKQEIRKSVRA